MVLGSNDQEIFKDILSALEEKNKLLEQQNIILLRIFEAIKYLR